MDELDLHYRTVLQALTAGRVVPFLGAGANLCGRPRETAWQPGRDFLPSGVELARHLARCFNCPAEASNDDLARVSQFVDVMTGSGPLYETLHDLFNHDFPPTALHRFLAGLPGLLESHGYPRRYPLIVTTNYDDLMERAYRELEEPCDVVSYVADGEKRGKFLHWKPDGEVVLIETPNEYRGLNVGERPVLLKIHGAVDRRGADNDSFVITEDHYIDYLTRTNLTNLIPATLAAKLKRSHLLFLGYGLSDWNLRVILHRIAGEQKLNYKSWAIQRHPQELDKQFWFRRDVDILNVDLSEYVTALVRRIGEIEPLEAAR